VLNWAGKFNGQFGVFPFLEVRVFVIITSQTKQI
jgi:hypothetical protein